MKIELSKDESLFIIYVVGKYQAENAMSMDDKRRINEIMRKFIT